MVYTVGLDIGSSGVKSTVFDMQANVISYAYEEYNIAGAGAGVYTLSAAEVLEKSLLVLRQSAQRCEDASRIAAISVSSIGESFICLDGSDRPLYDVLLYMDKRGQDACERFVQQYTRETIYRVTGCYVDPMYAQYRLNWLSRHEPEVLQKTARICFICDYITYMLGAEHCCDYSLAGRSGMFDLTNRRWWPEALAFAGVTEAQLPRPIPGGSIAGEVGAAQSRGLGGIRAGTKLILGGHDQIMTIIGSGASRPGDVVNGIGTVDCLSAIIGPEADRKKLLQYNMPMVPFLDRPSYATYAFNMSGGINNKWFRAELARDLPQDGSAYAQLNREAPTQPTGLLYLPFLCGAGTPTMDAAVPAVLAGLRMGTSRGEIFRAFLEGTAYEMRSNLECLQDAGMTPGRIMAVGGGSASALWLQIRADVFGRQIAVPACKEAGTLANAILCSTALGIFPTLEQAQQSLIRQDAVYHPAHAECREYEKTYWQYKRFRAAMWQLYHAETEQNCIEQGK